MYTRVVTNGFWAKEQASAQNVLSNLFSNGLCQLRLSFSRWHQQHIAKENILVAARVCLENDYDYYVSFITDFTKHDDQLEEFLRKEGLKFFPEPLIYSGRAQTFVRQQLFTDYQENLCAMNPYIDPDFNMYACCDAGSHFTNTHFFYLGNLREHSVEYLFKKSENHTLYNCIRRQGITNIASYLGYRAREIVTHRKCELCKEIFDSPVKLKSLLEDEARLLSWTR
jgi:hypothetical protein